MTSFFPYDEHETLMVKYSELFAVINGLPQSLGSTNLYIMKEFENKLKDLQSHSEKLFSYLLSAHFSESAKSKTLCKRLLKSKNKAKHYLTLQRELTHQQVKITSRNRSLASSLKQLQKIWKSEVNDLESTVKNHEKVHQKLTSQYEHNLEMLDKEFAKALEISDLSDSINTSQEFEELMKEVSLGQDYGIDNSRISMEKNFGGWVSEYDSESSGISENNDIKNAIQVLVQANLLGQENSLDNLNKLLGENLEGGDLELILQLIAIQTKSKSQLEDTTPISSMIINESDIFQTILSPGHKELMFNFFEPDSILEIN